MGLDPVAEAMPDKYKSNWTLGYFEALFKGMQNKKLIPAAFKPNFGFFFPDGLLVLRELIPLVSQYFPNAPIILDYKAGDVSQTAEMYARGAFCKLGVDAVTVNPFAGEEGLIPFAKYSKLGRGTYVWNLPSNPGAGFVHSREDYLKIASLIEKISSESPGMGAVLGATQSIMGDFESLVDFYSRENVPLLIPGIGAQGGSAERVLEILNSKDYDLRLVRVNSSSGLTHPWYKTGKAPDNWLDCCLSNIRELTKELSIK